MIIANENKMLKSEYDKKIADGFAVNTMGICGGGNGGGNCGGGSCTCSNCNCKCVPGGSAIDAYSKK
ncbi:MAG: hypothetical protein IKQ44_00610 [Lachnospiraceae bacterium]|nr:hypothetical protein [Lachnospiraceae bacterium]